MRGPIQDRIEETRHRLRTSVRALYCGDGPYSEYTMSFFAPTSPEEPKFAELMDQLALYLVPRERNPEQRR